MLTGKEIIELVDAALNENDGSGLEEIAKENPRYLSVWVENAAYEKQIAELKMQKIVLTMAFLLSKND